MEFDPFITSIDTGDSPRLSKSSYRLSPKEKGEIERQVKDLLDRGLIRPSQNLYGSPVLFVQEKDGSLRMCISYPALNAIIAKDKYPLPRTDYLLYRLKGAKVFWSCDLLSGYCQICIADKNIEKTAFWTHEGFYEYMVLPEGLTNAAAAFQREMKAIFGHTTNVVVYLNDTLIFSNDEAEHEKHLQEVPKSLRKHQLYAKLSKCSMFGRGTKFLGHIIGEKGISNPEEVSAIESCPVAYELETPCEAMRAHFVCHVSLLRPYKKRAELGEGAPPCLLPSFDIKDEVDEIVGHDDDADNKRWYQVRWINHGDVTWEPEAHLLSSKKRSSLTLISLVFQS